MVYYLLNTTFLKKSLSWMFWWHLTKTFLLLFRNVTVHFSVTIHPLGCCIKMNTKQFAFSDCFASLESSLWFRDDTKQYDTQTHKNRNVQKQNSEASPRNSVGSDDKNDSVLIQLKQFQHDLETGEYLVAGTIFRLKEKLMRNSSNQSFLRGSRYKAQCKLLFWIKTSERLQQPHQRNWDNPVKGFYSILSTAKGYIICRLKNKSFFFL